MAFIQSIWKEMAVAAVLLAILYAGYKGVWHWSPGVRLLIKQLTRERDDWRMIAVVLMREKGIPLPPGFEAPENVPLPGNKSKEDA